MESYRRYLLHNQNHKFKTSSFWRLLPAGMKKRWWLFRPFDLLVYYMPLVKPKNGLAVVRMDGIGDMVLFRNSLENYEEVFGVLKRDIIVIGCNSWSDIAKSFFKGYRFFGINEHAYAKRPFYRFYINCLVRFIAPEIVVLDSYFRRPLMSDSLVWILRGSRSIVSYPYISKETRAEFTYYLSLVTDIVDTGPYPTHELIRHANFVSKIGGKKYSPKMPKLSWRSTLHKSVNDGCSYVLLSPGSNSNGRRWPLHDFMEIAGKIADLGYKIVVVGMDNLDNPSAAFRKVDSKIINLIGKTDLSELLDLIKGASLIISNDTGPAHLAIGLGMPTIVIVGGGHFGSFFPYPLDIMNGKVRFLYQIMECYHCFWRCDKRTSSFDPFPCVSAVSVETVRRVCGELLGGKNVIDQ